MECTGKMLAVAASAAIAFAPAAHADVTRSDKNKAELVLATEFSALLGNEKKQLNSLSQDQLGEIAQGSAPQAEQKPEPKAGDEIDYSVEWVMAQQEAKASKELQCLTEALYHEARGEGIKGQFAVAEVILNRRDSGLYPASVCGVVNQRGGGSCQFSYVCDGKADVMRDKKARELAARIAGVMLAGGERQLTNGATHFHTKAVAPTWAKRFARTAVIGGHRFYRQPLPKTAANGG